MPETIDLTPTWEDLLFGMLAVIEHGTDPEGKKVMHEELRRMAQAADKYNELVAERRLLC